MLTILYYTIYWIVLPLIVVVPAAAIFFSAFSEYRLGATLLFTTVSVVVAMILLEVVGQTNPLSLSAMPSGFGIAFAMYFAVGAVIGAAYFIAVSPRSLYSIGSIMLTILTFSLQLFVVLAFFILDGFRTLSMIEVIGWISAIGAMVYLEHLGGFDVLTNRFRPDRFPLRSSTISRDALTYEEIRFFEKEAELAQEIKRALGHAQGFPQDKKAELMKQVSQLHENRNALVLKLAGVRRTKEFVSDPVLKQEVGGLERELCIVLFNPSSILENLLVSIASVETATSDKHLNRLMNDLKEFNSRMRDLAEARREVQEFSKT